MLINNPAVIFVSLISGLMFRKIYISFSSLLKELSAVIIVTLIFTITNPLFSHNGATVLFFMNGKPITFESAICGMISGLMISAVMIWCRNYYVVMTNDKFLFVFGKVSPNISLILSMTLRFIPMYVKKWKETYEILKANSMKKIKNDSDINSEINSEIYSETNSEIYSETNSEIYSETNNKIYSETNSNTYIGRITYVDKLIMSLKTVSIVLTWAFENSTDTVNAMKSRGYDGRNRTYFSLFKIKAEDVSFIFFMIIGDIYTITILVNEKISMSFYPEIQLSKINISTAIVLAYLFIFSVLPVYMEVKELIKWKLYRFEN